MKSVIPLFLIILPAIIFQACADGSHTTVTAPKPFNLRFHASLSDRLRDVTCTTPLTRLGTSGVQGKLLDLAFFIHKLEFIKADGQVVTAELSEDEWQSQGVALLDFQDKSDSCSGEDKPTNTSIRGLIANDETFTQVRFTLGIPPALNHVDPASVKAPLNAPNMFWSWQGGYKAMRFDVSPENGITRPGDPNFFGSNFFFHLGSTDCVGDPIAGQSVSCGRVNQAVITLDGFSLGSSEVILDLETLVSDLNLQVDTFDTPGCMSSTVDPECQSYFEKLGMDLQLGASMPSIPQSAFRLK
ncbi:MAG: metallo-mystery pair system four-Cys motif protein [Proteobacteria bacterium]|nr:MAG: metallo-mystery pair system four-Cys motif protein [Pseudomonadota bacterium]